jgi:hypothetical protein
MLYCTRCRCIHLTACCYVKMKPLKPAWHPDWALEDGHFHSSKSSTGGWTGRRKRCRARVEQDG